MYASNIAGSTLGPLVTGFVLLEHFSAELCLVLVGVGTLLLAVSSLVRRPLIAAAGATWATSAALAVSITPHKCWSRSCEPVRTVHPSRM